MHRGNEGIKQLLVIWTPKSRRELRKAGTPVNVNKILATAEGVVTAIDRTLLKKNGGTIELKHSWAQSLMQQINFVKHQDSTQLRLSYLMQTSLNSESPTLCRLRDAHKFL